MTSADFVCWFLLNISTSLFSLMLFLLIKNQIKRIKSYNKQSESILTFVGIFYLCGFDDEDN